LSWPRNYPIVRRNKIKRPMGMSINYPPLLQKCTLLHIPQLPMPPSLKKHEDGNENKPLNHQILS